MVGFKPRSRNFSFPFFYFLVFALVLVLGVYVFFLWRGGKFGKSDRFNLILAVSPVTLVSLDSKEGTATVIIFPDDLYINEVLPNYGAYKVSSVYKVGELDKRGGQSLSWTISELLGVPIDGYLHTESKVNDSIKRFFLSPKLLLNGKTDLNLLDEFRFVFALQGIRSDKINEINLSKLATPLVLADGSVAQGVDKEQLDSILAGDFLEPKMQEEGLRVEVVNSTPVVGLGSRAARVIVNIGGSVINVGSTGESVAGCEVQADKKDGMSYTVIRIAGAFSCKIVTRKEEARAQVSLILGQNYASRFSK